MTVHTMSLAAGLRLDPLVGTYSALPDHLAVFTGKGMGKRKGMEGTEGK